MNYEKRQRHNLEYLRRLHILHWNTFASLLSTALTATSCHTHVNKRVSRHLCSLFFFSKDGARALHDVYWSMKICSIQNTTRYHSNWHTRKRSEKRNEMKLFVVYLFVFTTVLALGKCNFYLRILFNDTVSTSVARFNIFTEAKREYLLDILLLLAPR
jgi:hypothetical protein